MCFSVLLLYICLYFCTCAQKQKLLLLHTIEHVQCNISIYWCCVQVQSPLIVLPFAREYLSQFRYYEWEAGTHENGKPVDRSVAYPCQSNGDQSEEGREDHGQEPHTESNQLPHHW